MPTIADPATKTGFVTRADLDVVIGVLRETQIDTGSNRRAAACERVENVLNALGVGTIDHLILSGRFARRRPRS